MDTQIIAEFAGATITYDASTLALKIDHSDEAIAQFLKGEILQALAEEKYCAFFRNRSEPDSSALEIQLTPPKNEAEHGKFVTPEAMRAAIETVRADYPTHDILNKAFSHYNNRPIKIMTALNADKTGLRPKATRPRRVNKNQEYEFANATTAKRVVADILNELESHGYFVIFRHPQSGSGKEYEIYKDEADFRENEPPLAALDYRIRPGAIEMPSIRIKEAQTPDEEFVKKLVENAVATYGGVERARPDMRYVFPSHEDSYAAMQAILTRLNGGHLDREEKQFFTPPYIKEISDGTKTRHEVYKNKDEIESPAQAIVTHDHVHNTIEVNCGTTNDRFCYDHDTRLAALAHRGVDKSIENQRLSR